MYSSVLKLYGFIAEAKNKHDNVTADKSFKLLEELLDNIPTISNRGVKITS